MEALWFCVVALLLAVYAILDGFDLGAGIIHLFVARTESERRSMLNAAGPFWDGHEIWLLLAGGALYYAFPAVYASTGFRGAAVSVLCLLVIRGIAIRLRRDMMVAGVSLLLALALGTAFGYAIHSPLPLLCGACGLTVLIMQSAASMALKSTGDLQLRCRRLASGTWWAVVACFIGVSASAIALQPDLLDRILADSRGGLSIGAFAVIALAGLMGTRLCLSVNFDLGTLVSASFAVAGLISSAAIGSSVLPMPSIMNFHAAWWSAAFLLAAGFNFWMHRLVKRSADAQPSPVYRTSARAR